MVCTKAAWACLHEMYCNQWKADKPKLHTYVKFKTLIRGLIYYLHEMARENIIYLYDIVCGKTYIH